MMKPTPEIKDFIRLLTTREALFSNRKDPDPVVSIITPFYNSHTYFKQTYHSIMAQTWQNFEWILVDDGSTDPEALELFTSLPDWSPKIRTYSHDCNRGPAAGRNTAIKHALGQYLFFMDADDLIDPTYIEKGVLFLELHPSVAFVSAYVAHFQDEETWSPSSANFPGVLIDYNPLTGRLLYRRSAWDQLGGYDENRRCYEDWEVWLRAIVQGQRGWTIPEFLDCYRRTASGTLATYEADALRKQDALTQIRSLYAEYFATHQLLPAEPPNLAFETSWFHADFPRQNLLASPRRQVLCIFPHLEIGGADKFNLDLISQLLARGYGVTIATTLPSHHPWHHQFYALTPDIFHLPHLGDPYSWLMILKYLITSRQVDTVLLSNSYIAYYWLPFLRSAFPRVAFLDYTHTTDTWRGCGYPRVSCQFSQWLHLRIVSCNHLADIYRALNPESIANVRTCYINVDPEYWRPDPDRGRHCRQALGIPPEQVVLLTPARLVAQKRPLFLVEIVKTLVDSGLPVRALILSAGHVHLQPDVEAKIAQYGLGDQLQILPPVAPGSSMQAYYDIADILLLPSAYEGISLAVYEAMAMGLPVVASDVGGQSELVVPEAGFLVPLGQADAAEVQAYIEVLHPLVTSPSLRQEVGRQARQRIVAKFSLRAMGERMAALFAEAAAQPDPKLPPASSLADEALLWALEFTRLEQGHTGQAALPQPRGESQVSRDTLTHYINLVNLARIELQAIKASRWWRLRHPFSAGKLTELAEPLSTVEGPISQATLQHYINLAKLAQAELEAIKDSKWWRLRHLLSDRGS